jgi:hypothetical protein
MITIHELLEDKTYRQFFISKPAMPKVYAQQGKKPWRLYVQMEADGRWSKKDLATYGDAFRLFKKFRADCHDAAIVSRPVAFAPPNKLVRVRGQYLIGGDGVKRQVIKPVVWRPRLDGNETTHDWCCYCRRPTIFRWFSKHHAFPKDEQFDITERRCSICGVRAAGMPRMVKK